MLYRLEYTYLEEFFEPRLLFPDDDWLEQAKGRMLCPSCLCIDRKWYPKPVDVVMQERPNEDPEEPPVACIETIGVTIWRREVLEKMKDYMSDYVLGSCSVADGTNLDDYATCYTVPRIIIRGNRQSRYQICPDCDAVVSNVRPGPEYVLARDLSDAKIFQDSQCNLYLAEDIAWSFGFTVWQGIGRTAVSIREEPADGQQLPGDATQ